MVKASNCGCVWMYVCDFAFRSGGYWISRTPALSAAFWFGSKCTPPPYVAVSVHPRIHHGFSPAHVCSHVHTYTQMKMVISISSATLEDHATRSMLLCLDVPGNCNAHSRVL
eukprot:scpid82905/ scgid18913/ 